MPLNKTITFSQLSFLQLELVIQLVGFISIFEKLLGLQYYLLLGLIPFFVCKGKLFLELSVGLSQMIQLVFALLLGADYLNLSLLLNAYKFLS